MHLRVQASLNDPQGSSMKPGRGHASLARPRWRGVPRPVPYSLIAFRNYGLPAIRDFLRTGAAPCYPDLGQGLPPSFLAPTRFPLRTYLGMPTYPRLHTFWHVLTIIAGDTLLGLVPICREQAGKI